MITSIEGGLRPKSWPGDRPQTTLIIPPGRTAVNVCHYPIQRTQNPWEMCRLLSVNTSPSAPATIHVQAPTPSASLPTLELRQRPTHSVPAFRATWSHLAAVTQKAPADEQQADRRNQCDSKEIQAGLQDPIGHNSNHTALRHVRITCVRPRPEISAGALSAARWGVGTVRERCDNNPAVCLSCVEVGHHLLGQSDD